MRDKLWVITVTPKTGWGTEYLYIYHNGDKAMDKFHALAKHNNLDIVGLLGDCAIAATEGNHNHIDRINIASEYTMD